jgi:hypothetical protein
MPASDVITPAVSTAVRSSGSFVRLVRGGRACPICAMRRCATPAVCANEYANRSWDECADCGGSGFDSSEFDIWCPVCLGLGVLEV